MHSCAIYTKAKLLADTIITGESVAVLSENSNTEHANMGKGDSEKIVIPRSTLAFLESLALPRVQEVVLLADFGCSGCQDKVATIMSRMNGETVSVEVSILEKKVTLTCVCPSTVRIPTKQVARIYKKQPVNNSSLIRWLFRSSTRQKHTLRFANHR